MIAYYLKLVGQFYQDMRHQKLRTFLTVFGICWGTIAVVLLLAFGVGLEARSAEAMHGLGANILIMGGGTTTKPWQGLGTGRWIGLRDEDTELLTRRVSQVDLLSPEVDEWLRVSYGREGSQANCSGVYPCFGELRSLIPEPGGRFINELDLQERRRSVFIGNELRDLLFGKDADPVGRTVMVGATPFTVVGVLKKKIQTSSYSGGTDGNKITIPYTTFKAMFGNQYVGRFILRASDPLQTDAMIKEINQVLGRKYRFDPSDDRAIWMWDTTDGEKFMHYFFLGFNMFLALGGFLTLLVGGIGVANIMYIVVRERRREIGIKMALGATPRTILLQFMIETLCIVGVGGTIGFAFSYAVVGVFRSPMLEQATKFIGYPAINPFVALSAIVVLGIIGFAAGFAPARRAASLDPIQALEF